jgi:hypothetical protein
MTGTAPLASASPGVENWWNLSWTYRSPITITSSTALADYQISLTVPTANLISDNKMRSTGADIRFWDNRWKYSMPITINNSGSALTDYQVLITVDTATPRIAGKMQASGADIRFKDSDNRTDLCYWIESGINTTSTKIWVKVPSVPNGSKTVYMYYGNPSATSASNESMTFIRVIDGVSPVKGSWSMEEASWNGTANEVKDSSSIGNHGQRVDGANTVAGGKFGRGGNFDGAGDYVKRDSVTLPTGSVATAEAWIYPRSYADPTYNGIVGWGGRGTNNTFALAIQNSGRPSFAAFGNDFVPTSGITPATLNAWNHIVAVLNGKSITLYMNGQSVSGTLVNTPAITSINLRIGCLDLAGRYFNGIIDEVRIYNRVLTATEISDIYNNYGYVTPNYPGKVLVRKYASTEPTTGVGSEVAVDGFELSHWIENGTINTPTTKIWVRVPSIRASPNTSTIYMYYGNPSATSASSGNATFIFFDDFLGTSLDTTKWAFTTGGSVSVSDSIVTINRTGSDAALWTSSTMSVSKPFTVEVKYQHPSRFRNRVYLTTSVAGGSPPPSADYGIFDPSIYWNGVWSGLNLSLDTWYIVKWIDTSTDYTWKILTTAGAEYYSKSWGSSISGTNYLMFLGEGGDSSDFKLDFVRVRKYATTEPTVVVGIEDRGPKPTLVSPNNGIATDDDTPTFTWEGGAVDHRLLVDDDDTFALPNENRIITTPTTTYTIADGDALADGIYYWKVVAQVAGDYESGVRWFRVAATSPTTPYLISPWNNLVTDQTTLTFGWSSVSGTKQYELWVDYDSDFSSPVVIQEYVDGTSKTKTLAGGTYYWKVRAWNWVDVPGDWSEPWKFTMENFTLSTVTQTMVIRGSSKSINVSVQLPLGAPTVSLSGAWIGTQPSGVDISFSPENWTVPFDSTLTFSTSSDTPTGPFICRITATSANYTIRTFDVTVSITTMLFSAGVYPRTVSLMRSDEATSSVTIYYLDGQPENVTLSGEWIGSIPDGVDANFDQTVGVPTPSRDFISVLSFTTGETATTGRFTFQVTGTSEGGATITNNVTVDVSTTVTITMVTDETIYEKMQSIRISGTAKNPKNDLVGSGTATISIVSGSWSQILLPTITDGAYEASYFITLANPEGTWTISVSAVDSYGNATSAPVSVDVTVIYPIILNYKVTFSSPTSSQPCSRGLPVTVTVQVTENDTKISGANVVLITFRGDNVPLAGGLSGVYLVAYTIPLDTPTGNLDMTVIAEKTVDGVLKTGMGSITVRIDPATLSLELISPPPTKREFEAGDIVEVRVQARYSDDSPVGEAIIAVNKPGGENLPLIAMGGGIYGATYTIRDEDVGAWNIQISAFDAYGNSSSVAAASTVIVQPGIVRYIIRYWPVVLAAILGLGVASAFVAQGSLRTRRLGIIKREKREIERLTKEAAFEYFKKGSIPRETYDNLTKEYATKLTNLDKEERILIDKMKKKKLSEKKHPMKKGR